MNKVKRFGISLLFLGTIMLLASCGNGGEKETAVDANTLTFYSWDNKTIFTPALDAFQKEYPDVKIEFSNKPPVDEYIQGLQTNLLSKTAADVFVMGAENRTNLVENKNVIDLSDLELVKNLNEKNKEIYSNDGKVYSASISSWGGGIAYNKSKLAEVGYSELPETWEEFIDLCLKLKKNGEIPYYEGAQSGNFMSLYALIGGQYEKNGGNKDTEIFSGKTTFSKEYKDALLMWNELFEKEIMTTDVLGLTDDQIISEFSNENVVMVGMGPWNVASVRESNPNLDFNISPVPGENKGEEYCAGAPSPGYSINSDAKNMELAKKFVTFLTTPEAAQALNGDGSSNNMYTTVGTEKTNESLDSALSDINEIVQEGKIYLPQMTWVSNQDQLLTTFRSSLQELIQGKKNPDQVLKTMDDKLEEVQK